MYLLMLSAKISEFTVNKSMVDIYSIMSPSFFSFVYIHEYVNEINLYTCMTIG